MGMLPCLRIAHRGASALYPENTLLAFEQALIAGVDLIELDVWLSRDGALVVIHDPGLERTTNGRGMVRDQPLSALRALNAGCGQRVPLLAEVIDLVRPTPVRLCIEIKGAAVPEYQAVAAAVVAQLERADFIDRAVITSFSPEALRLARAIRPTLPAVLDPTPQDGSLTPRAVCVQALTAGANGLSHTIAALTPALVAEARLSGLALWPWAPNTLAEIHQTLDLGVAGIMTDRPDLLNEALRERSGAEAWPLRRLEAQRAASSLKEAA